MAASIVQLCDLISNSISTLVGICAENDLTLPRLDDQLSPSSGAFRANPVASDAANIIGAAALQLVAILLPPQQLVLSFAGGSLKSAALRVCLESNVTEILREAGPQGLHVSEIAYKANINSMKLARLLRVLANHHIYKEIKPDVFANTLLSSTMDTGKANEAIRADPDSKHDGTSGFPAFLEHVLADAFDSSTQLLKNLRDPETAYSDEPNCAPFNRAFKVDVPLWMWYDQPGQTYRRKRFSIGMHGVTQIQPLHGIIDGFDWGSLPKGASVVDVGGGTGAYSLLIARAHPELELTIQDRPPIVEAGKALWRTQYPQFLESGRVRFQAHDFFTPQPLKNASVLLLKNILHDWSDAYATIILTELRKSASKDTKLVIIDNIMSYACHDSSLDDEEGDIAGAAARDAPAPLLANFGAASEASYILDMLVMIYLNSQERTFEHLRELLQKSGWSVVKARRADPPNNFFEPIVAIPIQ